VSICTGRMYSGTRHVAELLGLRSPVACVDGCHVVQAQTHESLLCAALPSLARAALQSILGATDLAVFAFSGDEIVHDRRGHLFVEYLTTWSRQMTRVADLFAPTRWEKFEELTALVVIGSEASTTSAIQTLRSTCDDLVQVAHFPLLRGHLANNWVVLVRCAGVNKGTAVTWMAEHFGVPLSEVIAVGDWVNDIPMFAVAGQSFVMGQSPPEVKAAATHELRATMQTGGGIAEAAEHCGLL